MADLTDLAPLDPSLWDDGVRSVIADMQGRPLNIHRQIAHHPELLKAWWSFRNHCVHDCSLSARHRELVVLRTAHHVQSE
ncbi:MAG: hypothetical protein O2907_01415 [Proteobacteria bacterium]|nr:hypothetical protein [Pseudomonadota bacterium]MDA1062989.1 hypothetical protein [Pseudomonadota bacterium]